MQVSTRGHFSSKIQKIPFITFLNALSPFPPPKKVSLWSRPNEMLHDKYHEFFSRQRNPTFLLNTWYFLFVWGKANVRSGGNGKSSMCVYSPLGSPEDKKRGYRWNHKQHHGSQSASWEILASVCHQGHGNAGTVSTSYQSFFVSLQNKSYIGK